MARIDELLGRRKHADPPTLALAPTKPSHEWSVLFRSDEMSLFRDALLVDGFSNVRDSIVDDLRGYFTDEYFSLPRAGDRARDEVALWGINLLWYLWQQADGFAYPVHVEISRNIRAGGAGASHLDFGSGVGVTSQVLHALGYSIDLADSEGGLLDFARFRLGRRGISARYVDVERQPLQRDFYDVVTAIDSLMFVPNLPAAARDIRSAMRPGGVLFANFDTRRDANAGWPILYHDDLWLRQRLQEVGFEPERKLGYGIRRYRAVAVRGVSHAVRTARDALLFPTRRLYWATRARLARKMAGPIP